MPGETIITVDVRRINIIRQVHSKCHQSAPSVSLSRDMRGRVGYLSSKFGILNSGIHVFDAIFVAILHITYAF